MKGENKDPRIGNNKLGIPLKYLRFFVNTNRERYVLLQGSRRSGKSVSVHKWLWFLASAEPVIVLYVCATYPALQNCIQDFQFATGLQVTGNNILGYSVRLNNGTIIKFASYDIPQKAQGVTADYLICEECLNIDYDILSVLLMSVRKQVFLLFNPTKNSPIIENFVKKDGSNLLKTTYQDNPYLPKEQIEEFERMRDKALSPTATTMDKYRYQVYVLGNFADFTGKVFSKIGEIGDDEFDKIDATPIYSMDFGFLEQKDFTTCVAVKIKDNNIYAKELVYDNGNMQSDLNLAYRLRELGINEYAQCVGDYGGMGATRIHNLVTAADMTWTDPFVARGFTVANAKKGKVIDGIQTMLNYDNIYVTTNSHNLRREMENYELDEKGKPHGSDHAVDALRYGVCSYHLVSFY